MRITERLSDKKSSHNIKSYDVSNWRFAAEKTHNGEDLFYIVLTPLLWISVYKYLTLEEFLDHYQRDVTLYVQRIEVINDSVTPCFNCSGKGKKDWVELATAPPPHSFDMTHLSEPYYNFSIKQVVKHYRVGPERSSVTFDVRPTTIPQFVTTIPKLGEAEEICTNCFGCGFKLKHDRRGNIYYWNDLNIWYKKIEHLD